MPSSLLDVCRFNPTLGGTTDWTYSSAVTGYQSPAAAGVITGAVYSYRAESSDLSQWEIGFGAYSGGVFARTTVLFNSAGTTAKINFSTVPQVAVVALAEDLQNLIAPTGRLTLTSGVAVMTSSVAAATTVYYTGGGFCPVYDGSTYRYAPFTEVSQLTTDTTKSPAAVAASSLYDFFGWMDGATFRVTRGPAWTNATTRSAGTALVLVGGLLLNSVAITNGPAASRGTYLGTIASNASSSIDFIFGASGAGGVAAVFNVWNAFNRVPVATTVTDSTASWTWTFVTSAAYRAVNNSAGNRVTFVRGLDIDAVSAAYNTVGQISATSVNAQNAIGLDTTTTFSCSNSIWGGVASTVFLTASVNYMGLPGLGQHFLAPVEYIGNAGSVTYYGQAANYTQFAVELTA